MIVEHQRFCERLNRQTPARPRPAGKRHHHRVSNPASAFFAGLYANVQTRKGFWPTLQQQFQGSALRSLERLFC
jgi:hypothetical protein